jgi:heme exporter protein D
VIDMNWHSANDFFAMGGYGLYVWGAYGATALVMFAEPLLARHRHRQALRDLQAADAEDLQ